MYANTPAYNSTDKQSMPTYSITYLSSYHNPDSSQGNKVNFVVFEVKIPIKPQTLLNIDVCLFSAA